MRRNVHPYAAATYARRMVDGMVLFFNQLINGLGIGAIYALIALGYTMVYGIVKLINFAHGDIMMVGSYAAVLLMVNVGVPFPVALMASMLICVTLGVAD